MCIAFVCVHVPNAECAQAQQASHETLQYVCPMHKEVRSTKQDTCSKCGMNLRLEEKADETINEAKPDKKDADNSAPQIPDTRVYDQDGRELRFYSDLVKGKTVAINFIFTTCTTICPPLTATFRRLQQGLGARAGRDIQLISISVDPLTDVPERLKSFAAKFNAGPGWTFVTGNKVEINLLLKSLGAAVGDKNDHTPMVVIGNDAASYWTRSYGLTAPTTLLKVVEETAGKTPKTVQNAANAKPPTQSQQSSEEKKTVTPAEAAAQYFPNLSLITQDNKPVRFFDDLLKGKTVLINFAFATCTGVCPNMTANLIKVQEYLGDRVGKDINMITISVDPLVDTPDELKKYAEKFKVKPGWYFLTGKKQDVDQVLYKLGGYVDDKTKHTNTLIIGNVETGEWVKAFALAKPAEIADAVTKMASKTQ
jgi:cytochrome oxidase Cu insertion factor (SCO1/SenC/PrrC family)